MKKLFCFILIKLWIPISFAQFPDYEWSVNQGGPQDDLGYYLDIDDNGNIYQVGYFEGTVDFDPGPAMFNLTSNGGTDIFLSKSDPLGNLIWAINLGSSGADGAETVAVNNAGEIYISGAFSGTVDFDPGAGINNLNSNGNTDVFIAKYDNSGALIWAKSVGGSGEDNCRTVRVDNNGNVILTGYYSGTVDFDPNSGSYILNSAGSNDIYMIKLDDLGNLIWVNSMGGPGTDRSREFTIDGNGDIILVGYYSNNTDMDPGPGTLNMSSNGSGDWFVTKFDSNGNLIWAKGMGGSDFDSAHFAATDDSGNIYVSGSFRNTVDFDPNAGVFNLSSFGGLDGCVLKLDPAGNFVWAKHLGNSNSHECTEIGVDNFGNICVAGRFIGTTDFDPGAGTDILNGFGSDDIYLLILDQDGNHVWAEEVGGSGMDFPRQIKTDANGGFFITGQFENTVDFDPGSGTANITSIGGFDAFILKMTTCQTCSTIAEQACEQYTVPSGDETYYSSGTYYDTIPAFGGGDSLITISLTINSNEYFAFSTTSCDQYTVPSGDATYTNSGIYFDTLTSVNGCDSILTINLTIDNSTSSTIDEMVCDSYTVPSGDETYTNSGIYTDTIPNINSCDSLITINLTIVGASTSSVTEFACNYYTVPSGDETYSMSGIYSDTIPNYLGCDSIISIDLSIGNIDNSVTQSGIELTANQSGVNYQWIICASGLPVAGANGQIFTPSFDGYYAVVLSGNGCTDTSDCYAVMGVGIEEQSSEADISIYPNPTSGDLKIDLGHAQFNTYQIELIDLSGKTVMSKDVTGNLFDLSIGQFESGTYFIHLYNEENTWVRRIVLR